VRKFNRKNDELRKILIERDFIKNAHGSCLISYGETKVICTANINNETPKWLKNKGSGWITAEYGMLPGSTLTRNNRESKSGKQSGRTVEIQRLIGRSMRSIVNLSNIDGYQITLDCDVVQADGGTRTASITGAFVALSLALKKFVKDGTLHINPIKDYIAAISCGIVKGKIMLDLDYSEDSVADVDANFVSTKESGFSEIQVSGEEKTFSYDSMTKMVKISTNAIHKIFEIQKNAIK
jgi:ribonuclease PH